MDLVFPNNNEETLLVEAKKLGIKELVFCYNKPPTKKQGIIAVLVTNKKDIPQLRKKADLLIGLPTREFLEDKRIDAIIGFGLEEKKDHTHFRRSITQADLQVSGEKTFFYSLQDLHQTKNKEQLLGRWMQDKRILEKKGSKIQTIIVSGANNPLLMRTDKERQNIWDTL